jgi:hypothetical protein
MTLYTFTSYLIAVGSIITGVLAIMAGGWILYVTYFRLP